MLQNEFKNNASITFSDLCDQWLMQNMDQWKPSTLTKYECMINRHIKLFLGDYKISQINSNLISQFSYHLLHVRHFKVKTVRNILLLLHKILSDIQKDPSLCLAPVSILYPKQEYIEPRVLDKYEQSSLVSYLKQGTDIPKFCVLLALTTGLRIGEICGLRWCDINIDSGILQVRHTVQRIRNTDPSKKCKTILHFGSPKTYHSIRTVPLTQGTLKLCKKFQQPNQNTFLATGNQCLLEPRKLQRKLKKYTTDCNLHDVHFHTLRHTFATRCIEIGCDMKTLSELLGHSDISVTMNCYVHPNLELKRENIRKLEMGGFDI